MENIIVIVLLVIIVLFALRATIKRLKGKGGCCSGGGSIRISILFGWWGGLAFGWGLSWGSFGFGGVVGL